MDTSEIYILMCEKAREIQKLRDAKREGDIFFSKLDLERCVLLNLPCSERPSYTEMECYDPSVVEWLPFQGQLQEMVKKKSQSWRGLNFDFAHFAMSPRFCDHSKSWLDIEWSLEMLWLAYVMKEKYGKVWDGTEWVKGQEKGRGS